MKGIVYILGIQVPVRFLLTSLQDFSLSNIMVFSRLLLLGSFTLLFNFSVASPRAERAIQNVSPRAPYLGGWPLALSGSGSDSCPSDALVACGYTQINPTCCPSGQTCIWSPSQFASYCCPTGKNTTIFSFTSYSVCQLPSFPLQFPQLRLNFFYFKK